MSTRDDGRERDRRPRRGTWTASAVAAAVVLLGGLATIVGLAVDVPELWRRFASTDKTTPVAAPVMESPLPRSSSVAVPSASSSPDASSQAPSARPGDSPSPWRTPRSGTSLLLVSSDPFDKLYEHTTGSADIEQDRFSDSLYWSDYSSGNDAENWRFVAYNLNRNYDEFRAEIGIENTSEVGATAEFRVVLDGQVQDVYALTRNQPAQELVLDVSDVQEIQLQSRPLPAPDSPRVYPTYGNPRVAVSP